MRRTLFCAVLLSSFSMVALTTPAKATTVEAQAPIHLAEWVWDMDDRYGFDRCRCPSWQNRVLQDCENVCEKYRAACYDYKMRHTPCSCGYDGWPQIR